MSVESETFSGAVMRKRWLEVIRFLLDRREEDFTQTEISEEVEASYKTVNTVVHALEDFGVVEIRRRGNVTLVKLNPDSPYVDVLEDLADLDARPLREAAEEYADQLLTRAPGEVEAVVLFGSVARGWPTRESDVDILILAREGSVEAVEREAQSLADRFSRKQRVSISPLVMGEERFRRELEGGAPLPTRIESEGVVLRGEPPW